MHQGLGAPVGWAAGHLVPILAYFGIHALKGGTKYLSVNDGIESLQWIAGFAQTGVAVRKSKRLFCMGRSTVIGSVSITFGGGVLRTGI